MHLRQTSTYLGILGGAAALRPMGKTHTLLPRWQSNTFKACRAMTAPTSRSAQVPKLLLCCRQTSWTLQAVQRVH